MGNRVLFPAQNSSYTIDKPGVSQHLVWITDSQGNSVDIGDVSDELWCIQEYVKCNILAVEYPGYGICGDLTVDVKMIDDWAMAAYNWLVSMAINPRSIISFGRSIGTGPAASLASRLCKEGVTIGGLILHCPYISIHKIVSEYAPFATWLIDNCWDIEESLKALKPRTPLLIIHGQNDTIIPIHHATYLYDSYNADTTVKDAWFPLDSPHNAYMIYEDLAIPIKQFILKKVNKSGLKPIHVIVSDENKKVPLAYSKWKSGIVNQTMLRDTIIQELPFPKDTK